MPSVWLSLLLRLCAIAFAGLVGAAWKGALAGLLVVCAGLLFLLASHSAQLSRLQRWLKRPDEREIPDAWGAWGNVFVELYRMQRREAKARARIEADLELFRQAARALPDGVVLLDAGGRIVWCNGMAERHLGVDGRRDAGLLLSNLLRHPRFAEFLAAGEQGATFTYRPPHNPGLALTIEAIPFEGNRRLVISFDVTQIERAETMRRDFVANVSHELRTPLTVINGFLELLAGDAAIDAGTARRQMGLMHDQAGRMLRLVDDLLTLSNLESSDAPLREEEVDMGEMLDALLEEARGLSAGRHTISAHACDARLKGAREELRSAFSNLVSNAVRYTPAGGRIALLWQLRTDAKGDFSVEDSGVGIAEEHIPRLTERFYRVDRGRSRESGGTGLGLAIVKHILLRHQAQLGIHSKPGAGSTFSAAFPTWRVAAATASPAPVAAPAPIS